MPEFGVIVDENNNPIEEGTPEFGVLVDENNRPIAADDQVPSEVEPETAVFPEDEWSQAFQDVGQEDGQEGMGFGDKTLGSAIQTGTNIVGSFPELAGWAVSAAAEAGVFSGLGLDEIEAGLLGDFTSEQIEEERRVLEAYKASEAIEPGSYADAIVDQEARIQEMLKGKSSHLTKSFGAHMYELGKDIKESNVTEARLNGDFVNAAAEGDVAGASEAVLGTVLDLVGQIGGAYASGGTSMFAQGIGGTWSESIEEGVKQGRSVDDMASDGANLIASGVAGTAIGAMEKLGLEKVFGPMNKVFNTRVKNMAAKGIKGFLVEGVTEGGQEIAQMLGVDYALDSDEEILQKIAQGMKDPEKLNRFWNSVILGGIGGKIAGATSGAFAKTKSKELEEVERTIADIGKTIKDETGQKPEELIGGVLTVIEEKAKTSDEKNSVDKVEGRAPKTRADIVKSLYEYFDFKEDNPEDVTKVERTADLTMALVSAAAKREGISNREWFQTNIAEIRKGLPKRTDVLDKLNQLMFHGSSESVSGVDQRTKSEGGYLHITPNLGVSGYFAKQFKKGKKGVMNVFDMPAGRFLRVEDSEGDYHIDNVADALIAEHGKSILIGKKNLAKLKAISAYMNSPVATFREFQKRIIDNNILTKADWEGDSPVSAKLSEVVSDILLREGFDGIAYDNVAEPGIMPDGTEVQRQPDTMEEVDNTQVSPQNISYGVVNPKVLTKYAENTNPSGTWDLDFIKDIKKTLGTRAAEILYQNDMDYKDAHGAVTFLEDGRAIISALNSPNASTFVHELFHVFARKMSPADQKILMEFANQTEWNVETEEKAARAWERYLAEGRAPLTKLELVFEKFSKWMKDIYDGITGSEIDIDISPQVQGVFDRLFDTQTPEQKAKKEKEKAAKAEEKAKKAEPKKSEAKKETTKKTEPKDKAAKTVKKETPQKTDEEKQAEFKKENEDFKNWFKDLQNSDSPFGKKDISKITKFLETYGQDIKQSEFETYNKHIEESVFVSEEALKAEKNKEKARSEIDRFKKSVEKALEKQEKQGKQGKEILITVYQANRMAELMKKYPEEVTKLEQQVWKKQIDAKNRDLERKEQKAKEKADIASAIEEDTNSLSETTSPTQKKFGEALTLAAKYVTNEKSTYDELKQSLIILKNIKGKDVSNRQMKYRNELMKQAKAKMKLTEAGEKAKEFKSFKTKSETAIVGAARKLAAMKQKLVEKHATEKDVERLQKAFDNEVRKYNEGRVERGKAEFTGVDRLYRAGETEYKEKGSLTSKEEKMGKTEGTVVSTKEKKKNGKKKGKKKLTADDILEERDSDELKFGGDEMDFADMLYQEVDPSTNEMEDADALDERYNLIGELADKTDIDTYKTKAKQGHEVGKKSGEGVSSETLTLFGEIRKIMNMSQQDANERIAEIQNTDEELTAEQIYAIEALQFADIKNASVEKLQMLNGIVDQLIKHGKSEKTKQIQKSNAEKVYAKNVATGSVQGVPMDMIYDPMAKDQYKEGEMKYHNGAMRKIGKRGAPSKYKSDLEKFVSSTETKGKKKGLLWIEKAPGIISTKMENFQIYLESLPSILDRLAKKEKGAKMFETQLHKLISDPLRQATTKEKANNMRDKKIIQDAAKKIFGKKWRKELNKNAKPKPVKIPMADGTIATNRDGSLPEYSKNDLYYLWLSWQQEDVRPSIESRGFGENSMKVVEGMLGESTKKWAEWQRDVFYKEKGRELSKVYEEAYGIPLDLVDNYVPVEKAGDKSMAEQVASTGDTGFMNPSEVINHFKRRKDNAAPIKIVDGDAQLFRYMLKTNHFSAFFHPARRFRSIVADRTFRSVVEADHGHEAIKVLDQFAKDITVGGAIRDNVLEGIESLRRNMVLSTLGANLTMVPKQLSSFLAYAAHMPSGAWTTGSVKFWTNPIKHAKEIMDLPFIKDRLDAGTERDMLELLSSKKITGRGMSRKFANMAMITTKVGDIGAIVIGGWPLYNHYVKKYGKEKGYEKFVAATSNTQQSGDLMDLSHLQRGGSMSKLFTTYMTTPMQYWRLGSMAVRRMVQGRGSAKENIKVATTYFLILPAIFSAASGKAMGMLSGDEEEVEDSIFNISMDALGTLLGQGIPFWNNAVNYILNAAQGNKYPVKLSPLSTTIEDVTKVGYNVMEAIANPEEDGLDIDDYRKMLETIGALKGVPVKPILRTAEGWSDVASGESDNLYRLLGQSASAAGESKSKKSKSNAYRSAQRKSRR